jgi:hypothetical protein
MLLNSIFNQITLLFKKKLGSTTLNYGVYSNYIKAKDKGKRCVSDFYLGMGAA